MARINTLALIGVGLIGGSLSLALRAKGSVGRVLGVGRSRANLDEALKLGIIDEVVSLDVAAKADVIFVATPVAQMGAIFAALKAHLGSASIITDGGSTKQDVLLAAQAALGDRIHAFVPAHPIAGTEKTGAGAAFATLYTDRKVVICRHDRVDPFAVDAVSDMWASVGANIHHMSAKAHDDVFAAVSHLPHLLAFALVDMLAASSDADEYFKFAASGFRDFTRIAAGSPEMWRDISVANRSALRSQLAAYRAQLDSFDQWLEGGEAADVAHIEASYSRASRARRAWQRHIEHGEPMPRLAAGGQEE